MKSTTLKNQWHNLLTLTKQISKPYAKFHGCVHDFKNNNIPSLTYIINSVMSNIYSLYSNLHLNVQASILRSHFAHFIKLVNIVIVGLSLPTFLYFCSNKLSKVIGAFMLTIRC